MGEKGTFQMGSPKLIMFWCVFRHKEITSVFKCYHLLRKTKIETKSSCEIPARSTQGWDLHQQGMGHVVELGFGGWISIAN